MRVCAFISILVLANLFVESGAICGGCDCNIWGCNCTWACGNPTHCPTGCSGCWPFCGDNSELTDEKTAKLEKSVEKCCNKKDVGGVSYTLVPGLPNPETHPNHCIDGCIYTQDGTTNKFCFAKGDLKVECGDQSPISINPNGNCTSVLDVASGKCVFPVDNCIKPAFALAQPEKCDPCNCVTA